MTGMTDRGPLQAISPLDGRYATTTEALVPFASEGALLRARVRVEVDYLIALADLESTSLSLSRTQRESLVGLYEEFDHDDAATIKRLETEGDGDRPATNHDVKAVEYFLKDRVPEGTDQWVHFGLTSEDVTNLSYRLLHQEAVGTVLLNRLRTLRDRLAAMARTHDELPMLAHTHGQPATPTTLGKELAVYAARLGRAIGRVDVAVDGLSGKLGGASGTLAAHATALPEEDWIEFSNDFVTSLGLAHEPLTTQVNPGDDLAELFDALRGVNNVLLDLAVDAWLYIANDYLGQAATEGETGSSTMPHKVNPIDFENSEGNLSKANADLTFLADSVTKSRLQRDLSDSTVKRTVGSTFAHCLLGYEKLDSGLATVTPNEAAMREDLEANPAVIGEAVQTILRREGHSDAYEQVKALTRGRNVTLADFRELFAELDVSPAVQSELESLTPASYTGLAADLVDELDTD